MTVSPTRTRVLRLALMFLAILPTLFAQVPVATPLRAWRDGLGTPVRIATDGSGRIYVSDAALGTVTVWDEWGRRLSTKAGFATPLGVAVDPNGRVYVAEAGTGSVSIFDGNWVGLGKLGKGEGEFRHPNHIAMLMGSYLDEIFVTDSEAHLVKVYSSDGSKRREFGGPGTVEGKFDFPTGIAVSGRGVFVADQNNDRIQVLSRSGAWQQTIKPSGMLGSKFGRIQGLLVDSRDNLLVADAFKGIVHVLDQEGTMLGSIGAFGAGPGQLQGPSSLAIDRNNRLFVASTGNGRVELFGLDHYSDPTVLQAQARLDQTTLVRGQEIRRGGGAVRYAVLILSVPGHSPEEIVPGSVTLNGIHWLNPPGSSLKVFQKNGSVEFCAAFNLDALLETVPNGLVPLTVRGNLPGAQLFEATIMVTVLQEGEVE